IAGLGLAVFATSTFTPTQQFGYLMITILSMALVGDLLFLPAILSGPIGKVFCGRRKAALPEPHEAFEKSDHIPAMAEARAGRMHDYPPSRTKTTSSRA
ncbi:MAG: hypothetical protein JW829_09735, partial [Pirellulales bacterium]|nr:hypothetical protein [Pirellulales bacterium]